MNERALVIVHANAHPEKGDAGRCLEQRLGTLAEEFAGEPIFNLQEPGVDPYIPDGMRLLAPDGLLEDDNAAAHIAHSAEALYIVGGKYGQCHRKATLHLLQAANMGHSLGRDSASRLILPLDLIYTADPEAPSRTVSADGVIPLRDSPEQIFYTHLWNDPSLPDEICRVGQGRARPAIDVLGKRFMDQGQDPYVTLSIIESY